MMETVSGGTIFPGRDIFKDGASLKLELKMARDALEVAENPEPCLECGCTPDVDREDVRQCRIDLAKWEKRLEVRDSLSAVVEAMTREERSALAHNRALWSEDAPGNLAEMETRILAHAGTEGEWQQTAQTLAEMPPGPEREKLKREAFGIMYGARFPRPMGVEDPTPRPWYRRLIRW